MKALKVSGQKFPQWQTMRKGASAYPHATPSHRNLMHPWSLDGIKVIPWDKVLGPHHWEDEGERTGRMPHESHLALKQVKKRWAQPAYSAFFCTWNCIHITDMEKGNIFGFYIFYLEFSFNMQFSDHNSGIKC